MRGQQPYKTFRKKFNRCFAEQPNTRVNALRSRQTAHARARAGLKTSALNFSERNRHQQSQYPRDYVYNVIQWNKLASVLPVIVAHVRHGWFAPINPPIHRAKPSVCRHIHQRTYKTIPRIQPRVLRNATNDPDNCQYNGYQKQQCQTPVAPQHLQKPTNSEGRSYQDTKHSRLKD